jgi:hypothetical protein
MIGGLMAIGCRENQKVAMERHIQWLMATLVKVLALNDLRNEFSHELDELPLEPAFAKFCKKLSTFWPPFDIAKNPSGFAELRRGAVGVGASICVSEVWQALARLVAARRLAIGDDAVELLNVITESERSVAQLLGQHKQYPEQLGIRHVICESGATCR